MDKQRSNEEVEQLRNRTLAFYTGLTQQLIKDAKEQKTYRQALSWLDEWKPDWINESGGVLRQLDQFIAEAFENAHRKINQEAHNQEIKK